MDDHRKGILHSFCFVYSGLFFPQLLQKFPVFFAPQLQVHGPFGLGFPQLLQKFPLFTAPQEQVQAALDVPCGCCGVVAP